MASTRNGILSAFKTIIAAVDGGSHEVRVGLIQPQKAEAAWKCMVWFHSDAGGHHDGNNLCTLRVVTAIILKPDMSSTTKGETQLLQANTEYDAIHAAIEAAADSPAGTAFDTLGVGIFQEEPGISASGFDDADGAITIGEVWRVTYQRARGAS